MQRNVSRSLYALAVASALFAGNGCSKSGGGGAPQATFDCSTMSDITTNTTFPAGSYNVTCSIEIESNAVLTLQPGTTLIFAQGQGLTIKAGAALNATGTSGSPITLKGYQATKGAWSGILNFSQSNQNVLAYVRLSDGGAPNSSYKFGANLINDNGSFSITNSTISNSADAGINMAVSAPDQEIFGTFTNNTISGCSSFPIVGYAAAAGSVGTGNAFSGNGNNYIAIRDQSNTACNVGVTLTPQPVPYDFIQTSGDYGVAFAKALTIQPGVTIVMGSGIGMSATGSGSINAVGTASNMITIKGEQSTAGFWDAILLQTNSTLNNFQYCTISDGGGTGGIDIRSSNRGMLSTYQYIENGRQMTVQHCSLSNSASAGIYVAWLTVAPTYNSDISTANTFSGCNPNVQTN